MLIARIDEFNLSILQGVSPTLSDASHLAELQQLRAEIKALQKKLAMQEEASMRAADKVFTNHNPMMPFAHLS